MVNKIGGAVLLLLAFPWARSAVHCPSFSNCDKCTRHPECGWCRQPKEKDDLPGCLSRSEILQKCQEPEMPPRNAPPIIIKQEPQSDSVQFLPQELHLRMIPGESIQLPISFKRAGDYPVDVYFLVDVSLTMRDVRKNIIAMADNLTPQMKKLTDNVHVGFGSFSDKPAVPYFAHNNQLNTEKCLKDKQCPYLFQNHLPLTKNITKFKEVVSQTPETANLDAPEGTLEALLQLAGIVTPHDGECHVNSRGNYTQALDMDYPSVGMIKYKIKEYSTNVLFVLKDKDANKAEQQKSRPHFDMLAKYTNSTLVMLGENNEIMKKVSELYNNITISLHETKHPGVTVTFDKADCRESAGVSNACAMVGPNENVTFYVTITVDEASKYDCSKTEHVIGIKPLQVRENFTARVTVHCSCECSSKESMTFERNSKKCSKHGDLRCGECQCSRGYSGTRCECSGTGDPLLCKNNDCSGNGKCTCGKCECSENFTGQRCDCNNNMEACAALDHCSGHGSCQCGECSCDIGWSGEMCNCPTETTACRQHDTDTELCSGKGECECNKCLCAKDDDSLREYTGKYCQQCTACIIDCSDEIYQCVECLVYEKNKGICSGCDKITNITMVPNAESMLTGSLVQKGQKCVSKPDDAGCTFTLVAYYHKGDIHIITDEEKGCPDSRPIVISAAVIGLTLLLAFLLMVIFKLITDYHDRREYEKFETQRHLTQWGQESNPLYRKALSQYPNPVYATDDF